MTKTAWSSEDLVALHGELLRQLYDAGLGRRSLAEAIERKTGERPSDGVMCRAMKLLRLQGRKRGSNMTAFGAAKVLSVLTGTGKVPVDVSDVSDQNPEDGDIPIEDLIDQRIAASRRKAVRAAAHERTLELTPQPFGLMIFGDPHVDNEGCDWGALVQDVALCKATEGVFAACVGDLQDNWIGRLQRLYSKSSLMSSDAWRLSQWLLEELKWVAIVGGNHDQWAHAPGVDPLKWIAKKAKVLCYANDEIRITFRWKNRPDLQPLVWIIRHDFNGRSWFHPTHGPHKEAMLDGKAHLLCAGHIHQWGQLTTEQRHERVTHALRVRGYKRDDSHARMLGFTEQTHGAAALVVIDPCAAEPDRMHVFWDLKRGCEYLTWLRSR